MYLSLKFYTLQIVHFIEIWQYPNCTSCRNCEILRFLWSRILDNENLCQNEYREPREKNRCNFLRKASWAEFLLRNDAFDRINSNVRACTVSVNYALTMELHFNYIRIDHQRSVKRPFFVTTFFLQLIWLSKYKLIYVIKPNLKSNLSHILQYIVNLSNYTCTKFQ